MGAQLLEDAAKQEVVQRHPESDTLQDVFFSPELEGKGKTLVPVTGGMNSEFKSIFLWLQLW